MKPYLMIIGLVLCLLTASPSHGRSSITIKAKARNLIARLKGEGIYTGGRDTLIDLNGDHFKDLLIEYYGGSGTGLKNRVTVYLYDPAKKKFVPCEVLSGLGNPTFYRSTGIVTGYYVANGGGDAAKFRWKGLKLVMLEYFDVDVN